MELSVIFATVSKVRFSCLVIEFSGYYSFKLCSSIIDKKKKEKKKALFICANPSSPETEGVSGLNLCSQLISVC